LEIEQLGVDLVVVALDLCDPIEVQRSILSWGRIGGVLHAAGRADWENLAFITKSVAGMRTILDPKVQGVRNLYEALKDQPLRFFVLFSSVAAAVPTLAAGQSDYAMANAFLDFFAKTQRAPFPLVSVQWPSWKESGMGEVATRAYRETGLLSCTDAEGLDWLDAILAGTEEPVLLPAVFDPLKWHPETLLQPRPPAVVPATRRAAEPDEREIESMLLRIFAEELQLDRVTLDAKKEFSEYGVDSILLAQVLKRVNTELRLDLSPSLIFEYQTLHAVAQVIARQHISANRPAPPPTVAEASPQVRHVLRQPDADAIAIVGMSCRFAGASTLEEYWRLLQEGRSALGSVPPGRLGGETPYFAGLLATRPAYSPADLLLTEADARAMDPQALLLLEESGSLLRHAGYAAAALKGSATGVYFGARSDHRTSAEQLARMRNPILAYGQNFLAANVSQLWDLKGPSLVVDTACSSALTAMKLAVLALQAGDIEQAVVGGISLLADDRYHQLFARRGILSPDPHFHLFDRRAHGVVLGEGVGLVLLKRREQALRDGDTIYALLRAIECNNDGRTVGPTTPSAQAQRAVMQHALSQSGQRPGEISYIEMNGTGSEVTDLLELKATEAVYQRPRDADRCALGCSKANIGHTLCAEGMAALIKVVLMLQHGTLVPFLSGTQPLEHHDVEAGGFYFCRKTELWRATRRLAAVNCFADGGTNVHAILEQWHESRPVGSLRRSLPETAPRQPPAGRSRNRWKQSGGHADG
jgi:3-oxoacyl-(acyl-carrier-protein) synthase/acyl carrier protein